MATTITLNRAQRDLVHDLVTLDALELDAYIRDADRESALERLAHANTVCELLDEIGWDRQTNDASYVISAGSGLARWLERQRDMEQGGLKDNRASLEAQLAGNPDRCYCGHTMQESIAMSRSYIERAERGLEMLEGLLREFGEAVVA
jgi:hypothetical protein